MEKRAHEQKSTHTKTRSQLVSQPGNGTDRYELLYLNSNWIE